MITSFEKYANARVPRYTSYPTALQFSEDVGVPEQTRWLSMIGEGDTLSLYFHVPFCHILCWYCGCNTSVPNSYNRVVEYKEFLLQEIRSIAKSVNPASTVTHIHFGGGSPTYLEGGHFIEILGLVGDLFNVTDDAEIAVEVDPRTLNRKKVEDMVRAGVNRVSVGVQDFDPDVQAKINRIQSRGLVEDTVAWFRTNGIESISFDLLYGLPGQTTKTLKETVKMAVGMGPDRFSVFGYAHVPWFKKHQRMIQEAELPSSEDRAKQEKAISTYLTEAGYVAIGFDHFARPEDKIAIAAREGRLNRNFQGYTDDDADYLIAFGASAISRLPGGYIQNDPHTGGYRTRVTEHGSSAEKGVAITEDDKLRSDVIMTLMCNYEVDLGQKSADHNRPEDTLDADLIALMPLMQDGLCEIDGRRVVVPHKARSFVRVVAAAFDTYLKEGQNRHSKAV